MFIEKVAVKGYQSLYDVEVELGQFTVIYGASDVGKSAFYRAFRSVVTCESGDAFISNGESKAHIIVTLGEGDAVHFVKRKGKSGEYALVNDAHPDGQIWKRNRTLPIELSKKLKFGAVVVEGEKAYPNFRGQFDPMFLMFESSGKKARMLGSLISNVLLQGIRQANVERNRNQADVRALLDLITDLEKQKDFEWDGLLSQVKAEKVIIDKLKSAKVLYDNIQQLVEERTTLEGLSDFEVEFIDPNEIDTLRKLVDFYAQLKLLLWHKESATNDYNKAEKSRKLVAAEEAKMKTKIDEFKAELMFECPNCGHNISRLEIEDGES